MVPFNFSVDPSPSTHMPQFPFFPPGDRFSPFADIRRGPAGLESVHRLTRPQARRSDGVDASVLGLARASDGDCTIPAHLRSRARSMLSRAVMNDSPDRTAGDAGRER